MCPMPEAAGPDTMMENTDVCADPAAAAARLANQPTLFGRALRRHAPRGPVAPRVLDLDCGEGRLSQALLGIYPAARLLGIDPDPHLIAQAQARRLAGAEFRVGAGAPGLPPGPFDLIVAALQ